MRATVRFIITDTHMGLGHAGLNEIIRREKRKNPLFAKVMNGDGGLVLFLNTARTACKLYAENGEVLGYLRTDGAITEESVSLIPRTFGGSLEYASAVKNAFKKLLAVEKKSLSDKAQLQTG